jgi:hypothetical protein
VLLFDMMMTMQSVMEHQLNNKNGGFGDILFFCFFFLMQNFFFKIKSTKNTHKQTNRKEREREREIWH